MRFVLNINLIVLITLVVGILTCVSLLPSKDMSVVYANSSIPCVMEN
jgi:hypothetical protein